MGTGNAKFVHNDHQTYPDWNRTVPRIGEPGQLSHRSRHYSTSSDDEESIADPATAANVQSVPPSSRRSPLSPRRASPSRASPSRASVLAPLSRESTAVSLGQRIAIQATQHQIPEQDPEYGFWSARIPPHDAKAISIPSARISGRQELPISQRIPYDAEADGGFLEDAESLRDRPSNETANEPGKSFQMQDEDLRKIQFGREFGDFHEEPKSPTRRGVSFAPHDEIFQGRSATFVLPSLKRMNSQFGNDEVQPVEHPSRIPVVAISQTAVNRSRPNSSAKKVQFGANSSSDYFQFRASNQHFPQGRPPRRNSAFQKPITGTQPSVVSRPTNSQWLTDDDSTSGIGSSTGSITSHRPTSKRQPRSIYRPNHSTSLPPLNHREKSVPWSDSELLLPRPSSRHIPPADYIDTKANFYHLYHHGIPKKQKKWVIRP